MKTAELDIFGSKCFIIVDGIIQKMIKINPKFQGRLKEYLDSNNLKLKGELK